MNLLNSIFYTILEMSIVGSLVGIITIIIRNFLRRKIPPKSLTFIWIVFLIILINPIRIQSKFSIWNIFDYKIEYKQDNFENEALDKHTNNIETSNDEIILKLENEKLNIKDMINFKDVITIIYFIVVAVKIIYLTMIHIKISKQNINVIKNKREENLLKKAKEKLNINSEVELINQELVKTPSIYGIMNTKILLTEETLKMSDEEIELILLHELCHKKNGDISINKLLQFLKLIYCFNPIIITIINQIKKDIELSNDESVLKNINNTKVNLYCKTLLKVSLNSNNEVCLGLGIASKANDLEERILMIKEKNNFLRNKIAIILVVVLTIMGITVCFATNKKTEQNNIEYKGSFENNTYEDVVIQNPITGEMKIAANYGKRVHPLTKEEMFHSGIDFIAESGKEVFAIARGVVKDSGYNTQYGNYVEIEHNINGEKIYSFYAQLLKTNVIEGENVDVGYQIGEVGSTGMATGPHLHFEIRNSEKSTMNPAEYLNIYK